MRGGVQLALLLLLAGCGEAVKDDPFAAAVEPEVAAPQPLQPPAVPVRVGEMGASFDACNAAGTTRNLGADAGLQVKAAPFDAAADKGMVPAGARFFICDRSHDQRWLGVVYNEAGTLDAACGVSSPVTSGRDYAGPCRSGWVASAFVKLIAG